MVTNGRARIRKEPLPHGYSSCICSHHRLGIRQTLAADPWSMLTTRLNRFLKLSSSLAFDGRLVGELSMPVKIREVQKKKKKEAFLASKGQCMAKCLFWYWAETFYLEHRIPS